MDSYRLQVEQFQHVIAESFDAPLMASTSGCCSMECVTHGFNKWMLQFF